MQTFRIACVLAFSAVFGAIVAAVPVSTPTPKDARSRITAAAEAHRGTPYRYGGLDRSGLDCSGLVHLSLWEGIGARSPRTARELFSWTEPVARAKLQPGDLVFFNTTGPLAHVGVFLGEDRFIHSASEGPATGVIVSSLEEAYWRRSFAGAGRVVPPAEYLGLQLAVGGAASFLGGAEESPLRGAAFQFGAAYEFYGIRPGLELRAEWDSSLGVLRVPLVFSLGIGNDLRFFVGPALVAGDPVQDRSGSPRDYAAAGGLLASGGVAWSPIGFRAGATFVSLFGELAWQRYEPAADEPESFGADAAANFRASAGVRVRWGI